MDRLLRKKLDALHREERAFFETQREAYYQRDAERQAWFNLPRHLRTVPCPPRYEWQRRPEHLRTIPCGATTRRGEPCRNIHLARNGRCRFHGGNSTGARTPAGRARQREGYRAWLEKKRASKAGRKRTRIYTCDIPRIAGATLAEISRSDAQAALTPLDGLTPYLADNRLSVGLSNGLCIPVSLTTTTPRYGGVRWWYVCLVCHGRRGTLYLSGSALVCRTCAGIHYAPQSVSHARAVD